MEEAPALARSAAARVAAAARTQPGCQKEASDVAGGSLGSGDVFADLISRSIVTAVAEKEREGGNDDK